MIHQVVSEIWVFKMRSTILEHVLYHEHHNDVIFVGVCYAKPYQTPSLNPEVIIQ